MPVCTFFGHRDCPESIKPKLRDTVIALIQKQGVDTFLVGNNGAFDYMVRSVLSELAEEYKIKYSVVLAYMPSKKDELSVRDFSDTVFPDGLEAVPRKFAVSRRNKLMLNEADYVVTYVYYSPSNSHNLAELAKKRGKTVINIE